MRYSCLTIQNSGSNTKKINRFSLVFLFHKALLNVESIFDTETGGWHKWVSGSKGRIQQNTKYALAFVILSNKEHFMKCRRWGQLHVCSRHMSPPGDGACVVTGLSSDSYSLVDLGKARDRRG